MNYRFDWSVLWPYMGALFRGTLGTLEVFIPAVVLSIVAGVLIGTAKSSSCEFLRDLAQYYVQLFRNIPGIVIIFFLYFVYKLDPFSAAVIGVAIHHSAYIAEVTQAGIRSAARGLLSTALASGFTVIGAYRHVVLPVALRLMVPPLTTHMIEILKGTSLAMTISFAELTYTVSVLTDTTYRGFEFATAGTLLYGALALVIAGVMRIVEARVRVRL
jgi:polar amino acid transport system permease protein